MLTLHRDHLQAAVDVLKPDDWPAATADFGIGIYWGAEVKSRHTI